jgi:Peptidase family S64
MEIPRIGKIGGYLKKEQVELRSSCQKFGRTTGYTQGKVFSIHLSIWVKYSAKSQEAFFKDQFLIIPTDNSSFVKSGDSGSLVADFENKAIGLIFAGAEKRSSLQFENVEEAFELENLMTNRVKRIENFGVANSISDVMSEFNLKIDE